MTVDAIPSSRALQELGRTVIDRVTVPNDHWEIAAQLEVMGLRDSDARLEFQCADLFELAQRIFDGFQRGEYEAQVTPDDRVDQPNIVLDFLRHYGNGLLFALPMAVQAATMLIWGYGIWGAVAFDLKTGTSIAIGFIASYVVTSGFSHAIVRRGLFYHYQHEESLARHAAMTMWRASLLAVIALAVPLLLFNALFGALPWSMVAVALFYYVALSILWLNLALIYLVQKSYLFVAIIATGLFVAVFAVEIWRVPLIAANGAALAVVDLLSFTLARFYLARAARRGVASEVVAAPRMTIVVYGTSWFFLYGFLYSSFLFLDRMLAWTSVTGREGTRPYPIWVSGEYELGMDLALMIIVALSGVVEFATQRLSASFVPAQKAATGKDFKAFNRSYAGRHQRQLVFLGLAGIAALIASHFVLRWLMTLPDVLLLRRLMSSTAIEVFWVAGISYVLLLIAMENILFLLTLARIETAVRLLAIAWVVDLVVGFIASRAINFGSAVWGLLAGTMVLAVMTTRTVRRIVRELDYFYYAAY